MAIVMRCQLYVKHATEGSGSETASDLGAVEADYQSPLDRPKRTDWSASPRSSEDQPTFSGSPATLQTSGDFSENNSSVYDIYASLPTNPVTSHIPPLPSHAPPVVLK